ncbi:hypothetical protein C8J57DRAFT_1237819 [Mycena rebaudengoi]|nr:hypothetical protein C8J57DRAFT_1237819 [Mycena rebaudengoi]
MISVAACAGARARAIRKFLRPLQEMMTATRPPAMPAERIRKPKDNVKDQASSLSTPRFRVSVNTGLNETPILALGGSQLLEIRLDPPAWNQLNPYPFNTYPSTSFPPFPHATLPVRSVYAPQAALRPFYPETPDFSPQTTPSFKVPALGPKIARLGEHVHTARAAALIIIDGCRLSTNSSCKQSQDTFSAVSVQARLSSALQNGLDNYRWDVW